MEEILFDKQLLFQMDTKTKLFVYGFMRRHSNSLRLANNNNSFYNIPELVTYICLLYFYSVEYFKCAQPGGIISKDLKTVSIMEDQHAMIQQDKDGFIEIYNNIHTKWISFFGRHNIESTSNCHCVWDLKLHSLKDCYFIIGLTTNRNNKINNQYLPFQRNKRDINYAYYLQCNEGYYKYKRKQYGDFEKFKGCQELIVSMDLNLNEKTISYSLINPKSLFKIKKFQGIMYGNVKKNDNIKYSLAVSCYGKNAKCTVMDFRVY